MELCFRCELWVRSNTNCQLRLDLCCEGFCNKLQPSSVSVYIWIFNHYLSIRWTTFNWEFVSHFSLKQLNVKLAPSTTYFFDLVTEFDIYNQFKDKEYVWLYNFIFVWGLKHYWICTIIFPCIELPHILIALVIESVNLDCVKYEVFLCCIIKSYSYRSLNNLVSIEVWSSLGKRDSLTFIKQNLST